MRVTWDGLPISEEPPFGATVVVFRGHGAATEVLLLHRAHRGPEYAGDWAWTPPAGARLPGETIEDCARRELREETGLDLPIEPTARGTTEWPCYVARAPLDAEVVLDAEHDRFEWVAADTAPERCLPNAARLPLEAVLQRIRPSPALGGAAFFEDDAVFATYVQHRARTTNPNDTIEGPAFLEALGDVRGMRVLELGCGDGRFGRYLVDMGARASRTTASDVHSPEVLTHVKIERITPFLVDRCLLVRVYTDAGIVGTGEAGLWSAHPLVCAAINELSEYFVGQDAGRIEHHFQTVTRDTHFQGAPLHAALSAIDIALWDILGKSVGKPVYDLLGGKCRDRVKVFAVVSGTTNEEFAESARQSVARGYTSLRVIPFFRDFEGLPSSAAVAQAVGIVEAIREAVGWEIDLGVEIHRNFRRHEVVAFGQAVLPCRLLYLEDPLPPENIEALRYVAQHVPIPLAAGERADSIYQFKQILDTGAVSLIRPDLSLAGGFTQVKKIAALAEAAMVGIFPHLMGSPVNIAAFVQLDAAIPNYVLQEAHTGADALNDILETPLQRDGGYVVVPDRPGIGVEIREEMLARFPLRRHAVVGSFHEDGSVAH